MPSLRTLFLDLNSYFASVEQQCNPDLRGHPIAVAPVTAPSGCCIAASVEAKTFGVKTGMTVGESRRLCPHITIVQARPRVYVDYHHRVVAAIETCLPVQAVHSIDEVSARLAPDERTPESAARLARRIKHAIREKAGDYLRCSIGVAPNRFLAKVGTDMHKPDGLVIIESHELPDRLFTLNLIDLPGIGKRMLAHLQSKNIHTIKDLCALSEFELEAAWGSIVGRRWYHHLRGRELDEAPTHRRSIGHQHVLAPNLRNDAGGWGVAVRLLAKAAARMRHLGYWAKRMSLGVGIDEARSPGWRGSWGEVADFEGGTQDTLVMVQALRRLWAARPKGAPKFISVTFHDLIPDASATQGLFPLEQKRANLFKSVDAINTRFGRHAVYIGGMHATKDTANGGIAFSHIPDITIPDTVTDRMR